MKKIIFLILPLFFLTSCVTKNYLVEDDVYYIKPKEEIVVIQKSSTVEPESYVYKNDYEYYNEYEEYDYVYTTRLKKFYQHNYMFINYYNPYWYGSPVYYYDYYFYGFYYPYNWYYTDWYYTDWYFYMSYCGVYPYKHYHYNSYHHNISYAGTNSYYGKRDYIGSGYKTTENNKTQPIITSTKEPVRTTTIEKPKPKPTMPTVRQPANRQTRSTTPTTPTVRQPANCQTRLTTPNRIYTSPRIGEPKVYNRPTQSSGGNETYRRSNTNHVPQRITTPTRTNR